jgi:hypothetical protein
MRQATQKKEAINFNWPIWNLPKKPLKVMFWLLRSQIFILPSHLIQCNWNKSKKKFAATCISLQYFCFDDDLTLFLVESGKLTRCLCLDDFNIFLCWELNLDFFQRFYILLTRMILMIPSTSENRHEKILITSLKI